MPVGPFDRRTRRSRCTQCAASHTKCSGQWPCARCERRGIRCTFSASVSPGRDVIVLDKGRQLTPSTFGTFGTPPKAASPEFLFTDARATYLQYFDLFIKRNNFTGRNLSFLADVQDLSKTSEPSGRPSVGSHLLNAMLALGAMQSYALGASKPRADLHFALDAYAKSITGLRAAVSESPSAPEATILWSTFFLGLFELMQDASGQRWLQHMVFGTSRALTAIGPSKIKSGSLRTFFTQIRAFEVCRSIIFNESSFLATPEWVDTTRTLSQQVAKKCLPDTILEIVVLCANLRARTGEFIASIPPNPDTSHHSAALGLALEGFHLRQGLQDWSTAATSLDNSSPEMLLATTYHAATSIYLSGNFDYDLKQWQELGIDVPILEVEDVALHFNTIVHSTSIALNTTSLSAVLFLFPLRVAGARALQKWQQDAVTELLVQVKERFIVAEAFLGDLKQLWDWRQTHMPT